MFQNRPAVKFYVPLIGGIVLGWRWTFSVYAVLALMGLVLALHVILASSHSFKYSCLSLYLLAWLLGTLKITYDDRYAPNDRVSLFTRPGLVVTLKGTISDLPIVRQQSVRWVVEAESVYFAGNWARASGGVLVSARPSDISDSLLQSMSYGRSLTLSGELIDAGSARTPGDFSLRKFLHLNG